MQTLSKDQVALRLQAPNGAAALMEQAEAALDGALALFLEDQDPAACGFLCRCAKSNRLRQRIQAALSAHPEALGQALFAPAPKLRKNAARLLGLLGTPAHVPLLIQALKQESQRFVRPSQLLALGALGGPEARAFLAAYQPPPAADPSEQSHVQAEAEALATARRALLHLQKHSFTSLPFPVEAELRAPDKLAHTLAAELTGLGYAPAAVHADRVRLHTQDLPGLFRARRFFELLLPLSENLPMAPGVLGDRAGEQLTKLLPACHAGEGPFGYRIELKAKNLDRGAFARAMAARLDGPLLANAPGDYEVELRVEQRDNGKAFLYAKLFTLQDTRFAYRKQALPASMHPATAAAVLGLAAPYLRENARVLDPCCGSGTFLLERGFLGPCAALNGVDIAHAAIDAARQNAAAAQSNARFVANDCLRFIAKRPYDEVLANLPFGNRVGSHENNRQLYAGILDRLPQWLRPGGIAILYTMEFTLLKTLLRDRPAISLLSQARTNAGGLTPMAFILQVGQPG